jgi:Mrp family chromosome partitioning ATPase
MNDRDGSNASVNIATDPALSKQAQLLSARVEAELSKPAVVMITSACAGDGKSLTACLLAASLEKYGYRVSLVEIPNEEGTSHEQWSALIEKMRSNYDFTVIDAGTFLKSHAVLSLARLVDTVLVAVRIGRAPTPDDESMVGVLEEFGGNVVGVVAIEAATIANFKRAHGQSPAATRPQPGRNPEQNPAQALMAAAAAERMS